MIFKSLYNTFLLKVKIVKYICTVMSLNACKFKRIIA